MSSKRGRKRNDNLPPNRARDVQRAFRARRAAHLLSLEQRVSELEAENSRLRKIAGWPPDNRLPLGKGPTGKDKPKNFDSSDAPHPSLDFLSSRDSESSGSARTSSHSPAPGVAAISSRSMQVIDSDPWEQALIGDHQDPQPDIVGSSDPPYQLPPIPPSPKSMYSSYGHPLSSSSLPSSSRSIQLPNIIFTGSPASYSHSNERPVGGSYGSPSFVIRGGDIRDEHRQHYPYSQSYQNHDSGLHRPPSPSSTPIHSHGQIGLHQRDGSVPVNHRRLTEQYSIGQGFPHLPNPIQIQQNSRQPEFHRIHNDTQPPYRVLYQDGHVNHLP